jgi:transcriptional regulator with XRE-family HTH domain
MSTKFNTVADAAAHLAGDTNVATRVTREIHQNEVVSLLLEMRISKGLTQEQVAERMGCDPSKVSRIESGSDRQLKWIDIVGYISALNVQLSLFFDDESLSHTARIKQCVFKIDEDLTRLSELAQQCDGDEKITQGIARFYKEVLFNFMLRYTQNKGKLNLVIKIPSKTQPQALTEQTPEPVQEKIETEGVVT